MLVLGIESSCDETAAAVVNEKGKFSDKVCFLRKNTKFSAVSCLK